MRKAALVTALALALGCAARRPAEPRVGDAAPEFSLPGSDGQTHRLSDYRGRQAVVLAWFPKAFTGG
jgi:thioredoxin-dependent peroxiredoxin